MKRDTRNKLRKLKILRVFILLKVIVYAFAFIEGCIVFCF